MQISQKVSAKRSVAGLRAILQAVGSGPLRCLKLKMLFRKRVMNIHASFVL